MSKRIFNLLELPLESSAPAPPGHAFSGAGPAGGLGAKLTGLGVYEVAPGESTWPYHFELVDEEWLIVVTGELTLRTPAGERRLVAGDAVCFPAGADGAHAVRNDGTETARFVMPSTRSPYGDAVIYPDSGTFKVSGPGFHHRGRLGESVEYWEGEQ